MSRSYPIHRSNANELWSKFLHPRSFLWANTNQWIRLRENINRKPWILPSNLIAFPVKKCSHHLLWTNWHNCSFILSKSGQKWGKSGPMILGWCPLLNVFPSFHRFEMFRGRREFTWRIRLRFLHLSQYPLVMTNIANWKIHQFVWENPLFLWQFSIAMLNYQRVFVVSMMEYTQTIQV